ncbi:MFS transporter [Paraburkholderia sp. NMBU_R16]|uniref:MFS transporter n=1 Tax=Paraburkholderia sp. NMBU_R16 TaxID=2698676 RepID=UPI00156492FE|nr:MFS transporter [Paraburkholderia sp. NMBU_R16]NRO94638.1 MFS transporter [Paraburkholderia sp. NMBU_R16]
MISALLVTNRHIRAGLISCSYFLFDFYIGHLHIEFIHDAKGNDMAIDEHIDPRLLRAVFATSLLDGLALFDLTVFGFFAAIIGDRFFPFTEPMTSLLLVGATFGVGFFARPLGALLLGAYADRRGRLRALILSCWLAALGTAALAVCPTYEHIGMAAPLAFVVARLLQGFAVGGEIGSAAALMIEAAPSSRRGFLLGCQLAGHGLAPFFAATLCALLGNVLMPAQLFDWGWRLAFAMGLPLIGVAYYLRLQLQARGAFEDIAPPDDRFRPIVQLFRHRRVFLICATILMGFRTAPLYAIVHLVLAYVTNRIIDKPMQVGLLAAAFSGALIAALSPVAGMVIDKLARRKPVLFVCIGGTALGVYLLFAAMTKATGAAAFVIGIASITALIVLGGCASTVLLLEAVPRSERATAYGAAYALGAGVFGSTAPLAVTASMKWTADPLSVGWYLVACCLLGACAAMAIKECGLGADGSRAESGSAWGVQRKN